jgi:5,6,7,8-tetrahydromethanopterin hydro-lyase
LVLAVTWSADLFRRFFKANEEEISERAVEHGRRGHAEGAGTARLSGELATQVGESFVGEGVDLAHLNTILGGRGGAHKTAWTLALATPRAGAVPFLVAQRPGMASHGDLTWGSAQAGVAEGIRVALANPAAGDEGAIHANNRRATALALKAGAEDRPTAEDILAAGPSHNAYFDAAPLEREGAA